MLQHAGQLLGRWMDAAQFDFWAQHFDATWARDRVLSRVVETRRESRDTVTLTLEPNRNFRGFQAGQHINVTVDIDGIRHTRSYSPSAPWNGRQLQITVQQQDEGLVSKHLCTLVRKGDVVELGEVFGDMVLPTTTAPLLLAAGGSGITPLICMLRELALRGMPCDTVLMYWAQRRADLCFVDELRQLAVQHDNFHVVFGLSREEACAEDEITGRPGVEQLATQLPDLARRTLFSCGSHGFVTAVREACAELAPDSEFHAEAFTLPDNSGSVSGSVRVNLSRSGRQLELPAGVPLLEALEAEGLRPAHGCRMGICKTCVCRKTEGVTHNLKDGNRTAGSEDNLRLCISAAESDLTLDL